MAMKRIWLVLPIGLRMDANKGEYFVENGQAEAPQPLAQLDLNQAIDVALGDAPGQRPLRIRNAPQQNQAAGYYVNSQDARKLEVALYSKEAAEAVAIEKAVSTPKTPFGVFECVAIFETAQPQILEKEFNGEGELRIKGK